MIGDPLWLVFVLAVALGVRHALEPDHIVAMTTLVAADAQARPRAAARLGLAWGAGHCFTLVLLGVPTVLLAAPIPAAVERSAAIAVGTLIVLLALRVLVRWRRGSFHFHEHDGVRHVHLHAHLPGDHTHAPGGRTAVGAFGVGLVHGVGGSAGATLLVVAAAGSKPAATFLLVVLGTGAAAAMAMFSGALALGLRSRAVRRRFARVAPLVALLSLVFGVNYMLGALGA